MALLRGINVGGKTRVEMVRLKLTFEGLGFSAVQTYINSGNVIFGSDETDKATLRARIEAAIERDFGLNVPVLLRSREQLQKLAATIPENWVNDSTTKCDVLFLWPELDRPDTLDQIPHRPGVEDVVYYPGAVVWRVDRDQVKPGQGLRITGPAAHQQLTTRNVNTVRKLLELMGG